MYGMCGCIQLWSADIATTPVLLLYAGNGRVQWQPGVRQPHGSASCRDSPQDDSPQSRHGVRVNLPGPVSPATSRIDVHLPLLVGVLSSHVGR